MSSVFGLAVVLRDKKRSTGHMAAPGLGPGFASCLPIYGWYRFQMYARAWHCMEVECGLYHEDGRLKHHASGAFAVRSIASYAAYTPAEPKRRQQPAIVFPKPCDNINPQHQQLMR